MNEIQKRINDYKKIELDFNIEKEKFQKIKTKLLTEQNNLELKIKNTEHNLKTPLIQELINIKTKISKQDNEINYLNSNLKTLNICKSSLENDLEQLQKFQIKDKIDNDYTKKNLHERLLKIYEIKP
ncbi:MAG: hypothetical protein ACLTFB_01075 [Candidatus Phytoplasma pyri]